MLPPAIFPGCPDRGSERYSLLSGVSASPNDENMKERDGIHKISARHLSFTSESFAPPHGKPGTAATTVAAGNRFNSRGGASLSCGFRINPRVDARQSHKSIPRICREIDVQSHFTSSHVVNGNPNCSSKNLGSSGCRHRGRHALLRLHLLGAYTLTILDSSTSSWVRR